MASGISRESAVFYLGKTLTVFVDISPAKNCCPSAYSGFFRRGSERMRAFVVGTRKSPGPRFTGRVIGLVFELGEEHGAYSRPEAMILAPEEVRLNQAELSERIFTFEEAKRYRIEPLYHKSCGAIVYRRGECGLEFLILNEQNSEKWGFPKGHMEHGESEFDTACREIFEEAGFRPTLQTDFREEIHYRISAAGEKSVVYFLSEYDGPIHIRQSEISAYAWITWENARKYLHRSNLIRVIEKAHAAVMAGSKT